MPIRAHRERQRRLRVPARTRASVGHAGVHAEVVLRVEVVRRVGMVAARGLLRDRTLDLCAVRMRKVRGPGEDQQDCPQIAANGKKEEGRGRV